PNHIAEPKWNELTKCENGSKCDTGAPFTMTLVKTINRVLVVIIIVSHCSWNTLTTSTSPTTIEALFLEQFTNDWLKRWSPSEAIKETKGGGEVFSYVGKWDVEEPTVFPGIKNDLGLVVKSAAAHHAISALLDQPLDNTGKDLVVQYEVKLQNGLECGGAYLKLLTLSEKGIQAEEFSDKTPYTIMFGPDRCGGTNKVHFIFRHKNPLTGEYEEKHMTSAPSAKITKLSTLYTLITTKTGNLLKDFEPAVNPPQEIDDSNDKKPDDWIDDPKIDDPDAKKPDDWDEDAPYEIDDEDAVKPEGWLDNEPLTIPDPEAKKPDDWDDDEDGDWVAPTITNPKCEEAPGCGEWVRPKKKNPDYKGKWFPPRIDNPAYKGPWAPRKIPNPDYFEDLTPSNFEKIAAVGFELWTMQNNILFDNIYIGHSIEDAEKLAEETWSIKYEIEKKAEEAQVPPIVDTDKPTSFTEDPFKYLQIHVNEFINILFEDPIEAVKTKPEVAGGLAAAVLFLFSLIGILMNLLAPSKKKSGLHKKNDEPTPDDVDANRRSAKRPPQDN
ncbi:4330_t:CDS:10, partial [Entrophospora sp. SA101]